MRFHWINLNSNLKKKNKAKVKNAFLNYLFKNLNKTNLRIRFLSIMVNFDLYFILKMTTSILWLLIKPDF
jgi:hypothetical protein